MSRFFARILFLSLLALLSPIIIMLLPSSTDLGQVQLVEVLSQELLKQGEPILWNSLYVHWQDNELLVKNLTHGVNLFAGYLYILVLFLLGTRDEAIAQIIIVFGVIIPMMTLLAVFLIWGIPTIHLIMFSPLLHKVFIFLASLAALLAFKQTFLSRKTAVPRVIPQMSGGLLLCALLLFWFGRVGMELQMSNGENVIHIRYSGYFSSMERNISYSELETLEWRYQIIKHDAPYWAWALYSSEYQKPADDEDPLVALAPEDDAFLTFYQTLELNSNNDSLLIDYDTLDVERLQSFMALCTLIAIEVQADCKPPVRLPPRPIFQIF